MRLRLLNQWRAITPLRRLGKRVQYFDQMCREYMRRTDAKPEHARMSRETLDHLMEEIPNPYAFGYGIGDERKIDVFGIRVVIDPSIKDEEIIFEGEAIVGDGYSH